MHVQFTKWQICRLNYLTFASPMTPTLSCLRIALNLAVTACFLQVIDSLGVEGDVFTYSDIQNNQKGKSLKGLNQVKMATAQCQNSFCLVDPRIWRKKLKLHKSQTIQFTKLPLTGKAEHKLKLMNTIYKIIGSTDAEVICMVVGVLFRGVNPVEETIFFNYQSVIYCLLCIQD